jgi:hypothetical protein
MAVKKTSRAPKQGTAPSKTFRAKVPADDDHFVIELPFDVTKTFGRARPPVVIDVAPLREARGRERRRDRYSFRWTVTVYGGKSYIGMRRSHREAAGLAAGQAVSITVSLDDKPRVVDPPPDLAALLAKNAAARASWEALSFTHKKEHAEAILGAKKPETRARRIEKTIAMLLAKPPRKKATAKSG